MRTSGRAVAEEGPEQERECLIVRRKKKTKKKRDLSASGTYKILWGSGGISGVSQE